MNVYGGPEDENPTTRNTNPGGFRYTKIIGFWDRTHTWAVIGGYEFEMAAVIGFGQDPWLRERAEGLAPDFDMQVLDEWLVERHMNSAARRTFCDSWKVM